MMSSIACEKEIKYDIETLSFDRLLNKEHFHGKIPQEQKGLFRLN